MSNLPQRVFPAAPDPAIKQNSDFPSLALLPTYPAYVDAQIRALQSYALALAAQVATATPATAVATKVYTIADTGTTLPATSAMIQVDTTPGPVTLVVPAFAATPRLLSIADVSMLNTPGSQGFAAQPFTLTAGGPVIWDPIKKQLVSSLQFSQYGQQATMLAILNHPVFGSFYMQTADALATTNVLLGGVVQSSGSLTSVTLPAQSGLLEVDTTGGPLTAILPNLGTYSPYTIAVVDVSMGNNSLVKNPLTLQMSGGLQVFAPWAPPNKAYAARTLQSYLVLGGVNDWSPARTTSLTLTNTVPPRFLVTG